MLGIRALARSVRGGYAKRDLSNILRYGYQRAPLSFQTIWIDPADVKYMVGVGISRNQTATVVDGDWDLNLTELDSHPKVRAIRYHFSDGVSWEETGVYEYYLNTIAKIGRYDGCCTLDDVIKRYRSIDRLFDAIRQEGCIKPFREIKPDVLREKGGIHIHVGRAAQPLFGRGGFHRLVIADLLGFRRIPAQLGIVHPDSLESPVWINYKQA